LGNEALRTEDSNNGLHLMINAIQHVYVVATHYDYNQTANRYTIRLKYIFYDVFGLDDEDLRKDGAKSDYSVPSAIGITAWWQLQHQHGYAPLITRIILEKDYADVPAL
jgi:hypothetical protein